MSSLYSPSASDPFGGRYQDQGLIFRRGSGTGGTEYVSGVAMAVGMMLAWASIFGPLLTAALVGMGALATRPEFDLDWVAPAGAPSTAVSMVTLVVIVLVGTIAATTGRHKLMHRRTTAGVVRLAISALALGGGLWWVLTANGIPF